MDEEEVGELLERARIRARVDYLMNRRVEVYEESERIDAEVEHLRWGRCSHPQWLVDGYGDETCADCDALLDEAETSPEAFGFETRSKTGLDGDLARVSSVMPPARRGRTRVPRR